MYSEVTPYIISVCLRVVVKVPTLLSDKFSQSILQKVLNQMKFIFLSLLYIISHRSPNIVFVNLNIDVYNVIIFIYFIVLFRFINVVVHVRNRLIIIFFNIVL